MNCIKYFRLLYISLFCFISTIAHSFEVDGIYYSITSSKDMTVGVASYENCSGDIIIPKKVTYNGKEYSVTSIEKNAFSGCSGLTSVTIPNSVTSIGQDAFSSCSGLTAVHITDLSAWCKIGFERNNSNPTYYAHHLYLNGEEITNLVIPDDVTYIGRYAFSDCSGLTSVTIPNSVTIIDNYAFRGCSGLTAVHITDLSAWCKIEFGNLDWYDYSCNPTHYAHHLYLNGEEITNLVIPDDITSIKSRAFSGCSGLTSVTIPNSVTSIEKNAFSGCSGLTSVTIPNSVTSIGENAFYNCSGLTSVTIPNSVTSIGYWAFSFCSGMTSVTIGNSVTSIGNGAFRDCSGITAVHITDLSAWYKIKFGDEDANPMYNSSKEVTYVNDMELTDLTIPDSITSISEYAFRGCSSLRRLTIPESCKTVPKYAFENCYNLQELNLPSTCVACYDYSFNGCTSLKKINCQAETPPAVYANTFSNSIYTKATLKVPEAYVDKYKAANIWKDFKTIRYIGYVEVESIKFDKATYELEEGDTMKLAVTVSPEGATDKTISWKSSNETIATVNDGVVTAIKPGNATITATSLCTPAVTATCKIVVTKKYVSVTGIDLDKTKAEMAEGETLKLTATISPDDATDKTITWTSSNESVATVKNGTVTAVKEGKVIITAKAGEMTATCEITVIHTDQCAAPVITYADGKLQCTCETEGAKFKYMLTDTDIKTEYIDMYNGSVNLSACYTIKAYAYADGYTNSEQVTATLYWINGSDVSTNINQTEMRGVMATCSGGIITVSGLTDGETVMFYNANGALLYTGTAQNGTISYAPSASGVIIVKIGKTSIKVVR